MPIPTMDLELSVIAKRLEKLTVQMGRIADILERIVDEK